MQFLFVHYCLESMEDQKLHQTYKYEIDKRFHFIVAIVDTLSPSTAWNRSIYSKHDNVMEKWKKILKKSSIFYQLCKSNKINWTKRKLVKMLNFETKLKVIETKMKNSLNKNEHTKYTEWNEMKRQTKNRLKLYVYTFSKQKPYTLPLLELSFNCETNTTEVFSCCN